ncbi:hypothetical protein [Coleofasciculus sp. G3-WIS-01]|uniref:hypothetical protein n=1 Tax=Coleofasciculus sp. G3-WIS-01 TaxID=3069528 RepID=UPI004062D834
MKTKSFLYLSRVMETNIANVRVMVSVLQHLDKARQHWILLDIIRIASCFTLAVSALNQSTGLKSDETRPTQSQ